MLRSESVALTNRTGMRARLASWMRFGQISVSRMSSRTGEISRRDAREDAVGQLRPRAREPGPRARGQQEWQAVAPRGQRLHPAARRDDLAHRSGVHPDGAADREEIRAGRNKRAAQRAVARRQKAEWRREDDPEERRERAIEAQSG